MSTVERPTAAACSANLMDDVNDDDCDDDFEAAVAFILPELWANAKKHI